MWCNFHTHSTYCDGKSEIKNYVVLNRNVASLGFSSHAPLPFECPWSMKANALQNYLDEIDLYQKHQPFLELYKGLEIDFIPGLISPLQFEEQLDFTIGSVHFVEKMHDGTHWEIDGNHALFLRGLNEIFQGKIRDVVQRYFELTREMVRTGCPTIIGHLDKIKIQNYDNKFFRETDTWYRDEIIRTLEVIEDTGAIIEVNTRGVYQKKSATPYPSYWILELIHQKNIPITLSSDAHHVDDVTNLFSETARQLKGIGFKKIYVLREGCWRPVEFNLHGLAL